VGPPSRSPVRHGTVQVRAARIAEVVDRGSKLSGFAQDHNKVVVLCIWFNRAEMRRAGSST